MRVIPRRYQDFVRRIGGRNRFGTDNWRIVWGPDRLEMVGGAWMDEDGTTRTEMREAQKYGPRPVYHLEKWCPPEMYGTWEAWEYENAFKIDGLTPELGIQVIGAYPSRGEYEHSFTLSGQLYFYTLEKLIRLNLQSRYDTTTSEERQAQRQAIEDKKKADWKQMVIDIYKNAAPAYYGPVSFAGQKNHTSLMDRLDVIVKQLERGISGEEMRKALGLGFKQTK